MNQLVFDEDVAAQLEVIYRTRDVRRRRSLVLDALDPQPGDHVVDVGCGPGFYVADLLERIGPEGSVTGVDPAPAMLAMARRRVAGRAGATLVEGSATAVPVADDSADRVLSVQVFEYVPDVTAGLTELRRVVRPGGRVVVWDIDWSTLSWHAEDEERMRRILAAWDRHLVHPALPRTLGAQLRATGFEDVHCAGHLFCATSMDPETYGGQAPGLIARFVDGLDGVAGGEAAAWLEEQRDLDRRGAFFFSLTQFCFTATRPA